MIAVMSFISLHLPNNRAGGTSEIVGTFALIGQVDAGHFLGLRDAPANGLLKCEGDDRGDHRGERDGDDGDDQLHTELVPLAAVEEASAFHEEAEEHGADETADAMDANHVERIVVAKLELERAGQAGDHTGDGAEHDGPDRRDHVSGRRDGDETGDDARSGTHCGVVAGANLLGEAPGEHCSGSGERGGDPGIAGDTVGGECGAGVEAEPAEPQQEGAEHDERNIVRAERLSAEALTLADDQYDDESGDCGVNVNDRTTCEVVGGSADGLGDGAVSGQQATVPHHVGERSVIERNPQCDEDHPGAVLDALGDGAADQGDGDHGERGLERHIHADRIVVGVQRGRTEDAVIGDHRVLQQEAGCRITEDAADRRACVGNGPAPQHPHDHGDGQCGRLHDHHIPK